MRTRVLCSAATRCRVGTPHDEWQDADSASDALLVGYNQWRITTKKSDVFAGIQKLDDALAAAMRIAADEIQAEDVELKKAVKEIENVLVQKRKDLAVARIDLEHIGVEIPF